MCTILRTKTTILYGGLLGLTDVDGEIVDTLSQQPDHPGLQAPLREAFYAPWKLTICTFTEYPQLYFDYTCDQKH